MDTIVAYPIPGFREPVNSFTHLLAVPVFVILGYCLVRRGRGSWCRLVSLGIMVTSSIFLLTMSGVYHLLPPGSARDLLRQLDMAGVFALIAGTVTPVHAILFRGVSRWVPLLLVWTVAVVGIVLIAVFANRLAPGVATGVFLLMGWGGTISFVLLWRRFGFDFVQTLLWGGLAYTLGAIVLTLNQPTLVPGVVGAHELWHVAVLAGLGWHWKFVSQFADGMPHVPSHRERSRTLRRPSRRLFRDSTCG